MDLNFTPEEEAFRQEVRDFFAENLPDDIRDAVKNGGELTKEIMERYHAILNKKGWLATTWPEEFGGPGWGPVERHIFDEESCAAYAPRIVPFGLAMLGPVLQKFGSKEQQDYYLPRILNGDDWWCQGYSEPGAGSDLASLKTRAVRDGDEWVINGQKIWTTHASEANWIFCLVRTDPDVKQQEGISFILVDMKTPGVEVRPIKLIEGGHEVNEVFFTDVRVPYKNLVGEENKGWTIAKYLLTHEREMIGGMGRTAAGQKTLPQIAVDAVGLEDGKLADGMLRGELATWDLDAAAFALTAERVLDEAKAGQGVGAASAMLKYYGTELNKRRQELMVALHGSDGLLWEGEASREGAIARTWLRSKGNSIEGGTTEVQLNVIARNILGLQ